jgi:hypothetical protein
VHSTQLPPKHAPFGDMHAASSCHWPLMPQVCGVVLAVGLQRLSPGVQAQQSPFVHPNWQAVVAPQCPLSAQIWLVFGSEHFLAGGTHSLQSLLVQAAQAMGLAQLPLALHVSKLVPLQRVSPGVQSTQ